MIRFFNKHSNTFALAFVAIATGVMVSMFSLAIGAGIAATATATAHAQDAGKRVVTKQVFEHIADPSISGPMPNIGQSMHLISVMFPAESATVTGLQVRIEASYDNNLFFAISPDITSATNVGGIVYAFQSAYGCYPYIRVRSLTSSRPKFMDIQYSGHTLPVVPFIQKQSDRFIL